MSAPPLPPVDPAEIPHELLEHVREFEFPTGVKVRRMTARDHGLVGWAIVLRGDFEFLYEDGTVDTRPRYRAYNDLGLTNGEDDLQGKPDSAWAQVEELQARYSKQMLMSLPRALEVAREHGAANRLAREGEPVTIRRTGERGVVADPGTKYEPGHHVRVQLESGAKQVYPLWWLRFEEPGT